MINIARNKIFGIGLNKTGTSTLGECGKILGLSTLSCQRYLLEDVILRKDFSRIIQVVEHYDLFEDWPWPLIYKELDQLFPGSKFILTIRANENKWLESLKRHSMSTHPTLHCRKLAYGYNYPHGNEQDHILFYLNHRENVNKYFTNRKMDFVELCWENGDGWKELCGFLGLDLPDVPFPHANKSSERYIPPKLKLINQIQSLFSRI